MTVRAQPRPTFKPDPLLSERLCASATLLRMMAEGEAPVRRDWLRSLADDLNEFARAAGRDEAEAAA